MPPEQKPILNLGELKKLSAQINALGAELSRTAKTIDEAADTNCNTHTCCTLEELDSVILPGEERALSGAELLARLKR